MILLVPCVLLFFNTAYSKNQGLLDTLNKVLDNREAYIIARNNDIKSLRDASQYVKTYEGKINLYQQIYDKYYSYNYDSAMSYTRKIAEIAIENKDMQSCYKAYFQQAILYASRGFYTQSKDVIDKIDVNVLNKENKFLYYYSLLRLYSFWANYCQQTEFYKEYSQKRNEYLKKCLSLTDKSSIRYHMLFAEYNDNIKHDFRQAEQYYRDFLSKLSSSDRRYASAAYTLAQIYKSTGNMDMYERYLILSAISDKKSCVKENVALQDLAMYLFNKNPEENLEIAERYIQISFSDALYYNNRLRIYEISGKLSTIVKAYEANSQRQYKRQRLLLIGISLLFLGVTFSLIFIYFQKKKLVYQRVEVVRKNSQLTILNEQLHQLNIQLRDTNDKRESLAKLYIDLCSKYIDRFGRFQLLVKRKIKANQINDLLSQMSSSKLSEEESSMFINRFDKAFLNLYPTFITEFNELLSSEGKFRLQQPNSLTPELRIFALIRLGVHGSGEIASLLFMSPQTIYNYRHRVKAQAISPETFESDVKGLCRIIKT